MCINTVSIIREEDRTVEKRAYAKINLCLDVIGKRQDGYHEIDMVMQTLSICDVIKVTLTTTGKIELSGSNEEEHKDIKWNESNLVYRAAKIFIDNYIKHFSGIKIEVEKNIPSAAGLGGGSSDAATTLMLLNELYEVNVSDKELMKLGVSLGADVPYFIVGGTARCKGIGEIVTPLKKVKNLSCVLVKPDADISTALIYRETDEQSVPTFNVNVDNMCRAINEGNLDGIYTNIKNRLENVTIKHVPEIKDIEEKLMKLGANATCMSGSGPTVFGLFEDDDIAQRAFEYIKKEEKGTVLLTCLADGKGNV